MTNTNLILQQPNMGLKKHSQLLFYICVALMIATIFARNVLDFSIPVSVILAIGAFALIMGDCNEIIALVICCIPMSAAFQYKYLIFISILVYIVKNGRSMKLTSAVSPLYIMMLWELLHSFGYAFSMYEFLRGFSELMFCTVLMMALPKKVNYPMICRLLAITSICMMSVVLINLLESANYNFEAIFDGWYRFGVGNEDVENFGANYNANRLGFIANLAISGLLQLIVSKKHKGWDYVFIVILALFGTMTMSRTFLICFALIMILFLISGASTIVSKLKRLLIAVVIVTVLVYSVYYFMPTIFERFTERFRADDITGGRAELFAFYSEHIISSVKHLFFGVGTQNYAGKINDIYKTSMNVCHNGVQELVVCWGIPGLLLFMWFLVEMIRSKFNKSKRGLLNYIPLILILVSVQAGQLITGGNLLLAFSFAYVSLLYDFKTGERYE